MPACVFAQAPTISGSQTTSGVFTLTMGGSVPALQVQTTSLPNGTQGSSYSANLTATGGVAPYTWNTTLVSGSLPPSFSLSSAGVISSANATTPGTSSFVVQVSDSASHTANSGTLSITVNSSGSCTGTNPYPCARTDTAVAALTTLPSFGSNTCTLASATSCGNLLGAGTVVTDPIYGETISRCTDATYGNGTMEVTSGGSGDSNRWNTDSTFIALGTTGGASVPYSFNTSTMGCARLYTTSITNGLRYNGNLEYSRSNRATAYLFPSISVTPKTAIDKFDLSNCTTLPSCGSATPPTAQLVYDFTSSANCLGSGFTATWTDDGGVAASDAAFAVSFSNNGGQAGPGAIYATVYVPGKGCIWLNTATGAVTGDSGFSGGTGLTCSPNCTGNVASWTTTFGPNGFAIHNNKIMRSGNWLVITPCFGSAPGSCGITCTVTACNTPIFWNVGTNVVNVPTGSLSGHFTEGYLTWTNNPASMVLVGRSVASPTTHTTFTTGISTVIDLHQGWNNVDALDTAPFCYSTIDLNVSTGFTNPYVNEIGCAKPDTSNTRWRFAHTFNTNTTTDPNFSIEEAIGSVSQDGDWYMWGTNGMGQFGSEGGSSSCTLGGTAGGTNCAGHVLIVHLQ